MLTEDRHRRFNVFESPKEYKRIMPIIPVFVWIAIAATMLILAVSTGEAIMSSADKIDKMTEKITEPITAAGQDIMTPIGWGVAASIVIVSLAAGWRIIRKK